MNTKRLLIIGIIAAIIIVVWVASEGRFNANRATVLEPIPHGEKFIKPSTNRVEIQVQDGSVSLPNFYNNVLAESENGSAILVENSDYQFGFDRSKNSFIITIYSLNLEETITQAERAFLSRYDLSESDACKLNVFVLPDILKHPETATRRLSFCQ
jgi:hypothetical protein